jgi:Rad3-related DNA helicase
MVWSLYSEEGFLEPLKFSNGKSQEDVVKEVLNEISKGTKLVFIKGVCGTGKSAIALNIAKELGKTSIVVPIKNLQEQYKKDYENNKHVLKENGQKLKISVITGRKNHKCKFLEENKRAIPSIKKDVDSNLSDIFEGRREKFQEMLKNDLSADNPNIPCKIEIREKNWNRIREYLKENNNVNIKNFNDIKDVKRISVASVCPYWCPIVPNTYELNLKSFQNAVKRNYKGLKDKDFVFYYRKAGCPFYEQFNSFIDSDVIVFNSSKYKLESLLNRKPLTEVEIIDECDEFLDSFSNQKNINLDKLQNALIYVAGFQEGFENIVNELSMIIKQIKRNSKVEEAIEYGKIMSLKETGIFDIVKIILRNQDMLLDLDEDNYLFDVFETAKLFEEFFDETFVIFEKKEDNIIANLVTTNLEKRLKEMLYKNKLIIMMSGTIHSENVLKEIFGLDGFKIIDAEIEQQGQINIKRTGMEIDCKYANFTNGKHNRKDYLMALDKCVEMSKKPTLVHVNSFLDIPSEDEIEAYGLKHTLAREKLAEMQDKDEKGAIVEKFKSGGMDILFSTRVSRGIDFPGEQCNSIIFTKYPYPDIQGPFWKILNKTKPQHYWSFYKDKAERELHQKIYRGLRSKNDKVFVLSPDSRVLDFFEKENNGNN